MPTVHDVPHDLLITKLVEQLKRLPQISPPSWVYYVKTGSHTIRPPSDKDWWYMRCASLLRKIYLHGPLGLSDLRSSYGGGVSIGYAPRHHRDSGGSAIRKPLQQLESGGLVTKHGNKGRILTSKGRSFLDKISMEVYKESLKINQETS